MSYRPGFLGVDDYLKLPREHETFLLRPLIPTSGAALIYGDPKLGKAVSVDTPILTSTGWEIMGQLKIGDKVYGSDGNLCNIINTSEIMYKRTCFTIHFDDDTSVIADEDHQWQIYTKDGEDIVTTTTLFHIYKYIPVWLHRKASDNLNSKTWTIKTMYHTFGIPVKCIEVDAKDHLYLATTALIPTHNSYLGIQLALAITGQSDNWLGFPVTQTGKVLYFQLDTPRSVWAVRFDDLLHKNNLGYDNETLMLADRETVAHYPFDILQPEHMRYLHSIIAPIAPVAVIIDTLREVHSGDEDSSTTARNVIANLVGATHPAALILISHGRKPNPDADRDLLADHRGSSYITGRMDAIMRLTKTRLYYTGRSIEAGDIKLERLDNGLWTPQQDDTAPAIAKVMADASLTSMRAKARALGGMIGKSEEAAMSTLRRTLSVNSK